MRNASIKAIDNAVRMGIDMTPLVYDFIIERFYHTPVSLIDIKHEYAVEIRLETELIWITARADIDEGEEGYYTICRYILGKDGSIAEPEECATTERLEEITRIVNDFLLLEMRKTYNSWRQKNENE